MRLFLLAVSAWIFIGPSALAQDRAPTLRTTIGIVDGGAEQDGRIWFDLVRIDQRFALDPRQVPASDELFKMLKDSSETAKSVSVHFFVDGATFDVGDTKPTFIVHDLTYDGRTVQAQQTVPQRDPNAVPLERDIAAANLAKGIALAGDTDTTQALQALSAAIGSAALEPALKALALKTRSGVNEDHATAGPAGPERDKQLFAAFSDALAWQALAPDDPFAASGVARTQAYLGAYDEAIAAYRGIIDKWPDQLFWAEVGTAVIYRRLGQYDKALASLNELVKRNGPQAGMAYHYHRGWTLMKASRFAEAVAEFTKGLKDQPDYEGAFMFRACALAQTGKLGDAIADQEQVVKIFNEFGKDTPPPESLTRDRQHAAEVLKALQTTYAQNPKGKLDAPCTGYSDWAESKRERSALLPPPTKR